MSAAVSICEIERAYEAVRAQALGAPSQRAPRGLALLIARGLPAWLGACPSFVSTMSPPPASAARTALSGPRAELVSALTEMALACRPRRLSS